MKVNWDSEVCIHAGECVGNLPSVFKVVDDKFVIDESGASAREIRAAVAMCPSGALTVSE
ncbi:MAG: (4Fe-4S)-binding protein [Thermodesulfobacteriota bacterium]